MRGAENGGNIRENSVFSWFIGRCPFEKRDSTLKWVEFYLLIFDKQ